MWLFHFLVIQISSFVELILEYITHNQDNPDTLSLYGLIEAAISAAHFYDGVIGMTLTVRKEDKVAKYLLLAPSIDKILTFTPFG